MSAAQQHAEGPARRRTRRGLRKDAVRRAVEGAIAGGMPVGSIRFFDDGSFVLSALDAVAPQTEADLLEQRMREAFGSDDD